MYSAKSKINSCTGDPDWPLDVSRFQPPMGFETAGRLTEDRWRKSHQWCAQGTCSPWRALLCGAPFCHALCKAGHAASRPVCTVCAILQRARARAACHSRACSYLAAHAVVRGAHNAGGAGIADRRAAAVGRRVGLVRKHAQTIVDDVEIAAVRPRARLS